MTINQLLKMAVTSVVRVLSRRNRRPVVEERNPLLNRGVVYIQQHSAFGHQHNVKFKELRFETVSSTSRSQITLTVVGLRTQRVKVKSPQVQKTIFFYIYIYFFFGGLEWCMVGYKVWLMHSAQKA